MKGRHYVDDLLVKSKELGEQVVDLQEALSVLHQYKMKFNPTNCGFGMDSGKLLSFMISERGI